METLIDSLRAFLVNNEKNAKIDVIKWMNSIEYQVNSIYFVDFLNPVVNRVDKHLECIVNSIDKSAGNTLLRQEC